jgi:hypothetical protein
MLRQVAQAILFGTHSIFLGSEVSGHVCGKDPILKKKLERWDAMFDKEKESLGFILNGRFQTVCLPNSKAMAMIKESKRVLKKKQCSL